MDPNGAPPSSASEPSSNRWSERKPVLVVFAVQLLALAALAGYINTDHPAAVTADLSGEAHLAAGR